MGKVSVSNRPDLCEYQCNGAMAGAKKYHKAPLVIAGEVAEKLAESEVFCRGRSSGTGISESENFRGISVKTASPDGRGAEIWSGSTGEEKENYYRLRRSERGKASSRRSSAFCGYRREHQAHRTDYVGHEVIGDVHLGDWGLQMGLDYYGIEGDESRSWFILMRAIQGEYPREAPFTISELEEIYPAASAKSKGGCQLIRRKPWRQPISCRTV